MHSRAYKQRTPIDRQKTDILKYLSVEFFSEKSKTIQDQTAYECRDLGQKLGYDTSVLFYPQSRQRRRPAFILASQAFIVLHS